MVTFVVSMVLLVLGYMLYGRFVEKVFGPDPNRPTPAIAHPDGVDYVAMPGWKVFMIQFLNIDGTGSIFGAIMGALYGPSAYLWIVLGCIFAGSVHDYFSGMLSLRHNGAALPELVGTYLGGTAKKVMLVFSVLLLMMVGVVFVYTPSLILYKIPLWAESAIFSNVLTWILIILAYYILATLCPIDKIIGKVYPIFALSLIFMAVSLGISLFSKWPAVPEIWDGLDHMGAAKFGMKDHIFPALFITIACGAISGFHATQSPLMARCLKNEKQGRAIFYGAMITEGFSGLIWATVSSYFFYADGWKEVVPEAMLAQFNASGLQLNQFFDAPTVVNLVCNGWLGIVGGALALLGVVAAPITSGDTALRSCRLIIADFFKFDQSKIAHRLMVSVPIFVACFALLYWQIENPNGFNTIWKYFGWSNQTLSVFTLWTITVYLAKSKKAYIITLIPALFMTAVCSSFFLVSKIALGLPEIIAYPVSGIFTLICLIAFIVFERKLKINDKIVKE